MFEKEKFVTYHFKQALAAGIFMLLITAAQVAMEENIFIRYKNTPPVTVMGVATQDEEILRDKKNIINYQNDVKIILNDYLNLRASFNEAHRDWLVLINTTKYNLLKLAVPDEYKDMQVKLITTLDEEYRAVFDSDNNKIYAVSLKWHALTEQFFWIN